MTPSRTGRRRRARPTGDHGASFAELLVSAAILAVVLPVAGGLLQHALFAQRDVSAVTSASNAAQLVAMSVETGVHNASAIAPLVTYPSSGPFPHELLVVRTRSAIPNAATDRDPKPVWTCQAWYYDADTRTVYVRQATVPATSPATPLISRPAAPDFTGWMELARGVTPRSRTAATPPAPSAPLPTVFTPSATRVGLGLQVEARAGKPVVLTTTITKHPQNDPRTQPCF